MTRLLCVLGLIGLAATAFESLHAADVHWNGSAGNNWQTDANWDPICGPLFCATPRPPSNSDNAILSNAPLGSTLARLTANVSIDDLTIENGIEVDLAGHRLLAIAVDVIGADSQIRVEGNQTDGKLSASALDLFNGGKLIVDDPTNTGSRETVRIRGPGLSSVDVNSSIEGTGKVTFNPTNTIQLVRTVFENDGVIRPLFGKLEFESKESKYRYDLDGPNENGIIDVESGSFLTTDVDFVFTGISSDPFDGTLIIGQNDSARFSSSWDFGTSGTGNATITMNGGSGTATLGSTRPSDDPFPELHLVRGTATRIDVNSGTALLDLNLDLSEGAMNVGSSTTVHFARSANLASSFSFQSGPGYQLVVDGAVSFAQSTLDWDSTAPGTHTTTVNPGGSFHISSDSINPDDNTFRGLVVLNGGLLSVQTVSPWVLSGQMQMNHAPEEVATLSGGAVTVGNGVDLGNDSRIQVTGAGTSAIGAVASFRSDAEIEIDPESTLLTTTNATYEAGVEITGGGTLTGFGKSTFDDGISIAASLVNRGTLEIVDGGVGTLTVDSFVQTGPLSELVIDVLSTQANDLDRLDVVGEANLGGTLNFDWQGAGLPTVGEEFSILTASNVVGSFETLILPGLSGTDMWQVVYLPTEVQLRVVGQLDADVDSDGDVDGTDFLLIQRNNPALIPLWQSQYGTNPLAAGVAVPEPTTGMLVIAAALSLHFARKEAHR